MEDPALEFPGVNVAIRNVAVHVKPTGWLLPGSKTKSLGATKCSQTLLKRVSADFPAGSLTAILGGSGSGKTTLLQTISGRLPPTHFNFSGSITYNENERARDIRSGYVMQEEFLVPTLTVRETLRYAADLRHPFHSTTEERYAAVENTILELGLKECADTRIGSSEGGLCSGGEKRRTSVGVQLLAQPSIVYCDEPTTGLDAHCAFQMVRTLKDLAKTGRTVVITIHAPRSEIWNLFDNVILLTKGACLYSGPALDMISHFDSCGFSLPPMVNPAEYFVDLATVNGSSESAEKASMTRLQYLESKWDEKADMQKMAAKLDLSVPCISTASLETYRAATKVGFMRQLRVITQRTATTCLRDPFGFVGCMLQAVVMAIGYGWIFYKLGVDQAGIRSREGALHIATYQCYPMMMFEIYRLSSEIRLFDMERRDGVLDVPAFILGRRLAKCLIEDLPIPVLFSVIYYFMIGLRVDVATLWIFLATVVSSQFIAVTGALLCVAVSRDFATATLCGNLIYTFNFLCTGYILQTNQIPVYLRWIKYLTYNFYTYSLLALNEFIGIDGGSIGNMYGCIDPSVPSDQLCTRINGAYVIGSLGLTTDFLFRALIVSLAYPLIFLVMAGIVLEIFPANLGTARSKLSLGAEEGGYVDVPPSQLGNNQRLQLALEDYALVVQSRRILSWKPPKTILQSLSVSFPCGTMNVIMGPSGSGKTSLLASVAGRLRSGPGVKYRVSGKITVNGSVLDRGLLSSVISYVPQTDDALMPALTVRECLQFAAGIRLPPTMSREEKNLRAEALITQMGLKHCSKHRIGDALNKGISGGEKRRVSIAVQVLTNPSILILDEPTSGLDVCTAAAILKLLRDLANEGRTIIMTVHQSRSDAFSTFDNVLLLARGGMMVYSGEAKNVVPHFQSMGYECNLQTNPADFVLDLITVDLQHQEKEELSRRRVDTMARLWETKKFMTHVSAEEVSANHADTHCLKRVRNSFWTIFMLVLRRSALNISRKPEFVIARTLQIIGMAALFAIFYAPLQNNAEAIQTRMGYIQTVTSFCFLGILSNVAVYPTERNSFYHEALDGCYGAFTFLTTYTILEFPFLVLTSFSFGVIATYGVNLLRTPGAMFLISLDALCIISCGESLGIICCTMFSKHIGASMIVSSALLSFASTMSGVVALSIPAPLQALNWLSPSKYMVANIVQFTMPGQAFGCTPEQMLDAGRCPIENGDDVMRLYGLEGSWRWNLVALVITTALYRAVAFLVVWTSRVEWGLPMGWRGRRWSFKTRLQRGGSLEMV